MELKEKKTVNSTNIDSSFQEELLQEFYTSAIESLDKFELHIFDYTDSTDLKHINAFKMALHSLIGSALSVELKKFAGFLYKFDAIIDENIKEKNVDQYINFYYFVIDKLRLYFYQLEKNENVELSEKIITSTLERKGESERTYLVRCVKDLEDQLATLKKSLADLDAKSSVTSASSASVKNDPEAA